MNGLWVFLGGGTGAVLRWLLSGLLPAPWGTMAVNVAGSFLLAALLHPSTELSDPARLVFATGMMGGFTTYSTFNHDVLTALQSGAYGHAALVAFGSLLGCLVGGALGWWLASFRG